MTFHDFSMTFAIFHDFPGLENGPPKFHDFPWPGGHPVNINMKKALTETQTLHIHGCSKAEPKNFGPLQTPFPGAQDSQNLNSWRWLLPGPTDLVWWRSMHAILSYRGNRPTNTHTHIHTQTNPDKTGPITIHCPTASAQCNKKTLLQLTAYFKNIPLAPFLLFE